MDRIPSADALARSGINTSNSFCMLCKEEMEVTYHLVNRGFSKKILLWILNWCHIPPRQFEKVSDFVEFATNWGVVLRRKKFLLPFVIGSCDVFGRRETTWFLKRLGLPCFCWPISLSLWCLVSCCIEVILIIIIRRIGFINRLTFYIMFWFLSLPFIFLGSGYLRQLKKKKKKRIG